ncbi:MAG: hypothetical protein LBL34_01365 [Clostridiales bacterium]|jgi:hypothetical protein|nr:hypothetical protein [Clostridiales bacterium]
MEKEKNTHECANEQVYCLFEGRHELPQNNGVVFNAVVNPADIAGIEAQASDFVAKLGDDVDGITVYVTGLTVGTVSLIKACANKGVGLTLLHYNAATGEYMPQEAISVGQSL